MASESRIYRALATAQQLVEAGLATGIIVQGGTVYVENGICAGCGTEPYPLPILVDEPNAGNPWCPGCGGRALVDGVLDLTPPGEFENGLCRMAGSGTKHLIAPPFGQHPLCMPNAKVGRMQPVTTAGTADCKRCLAMDAGTVFGVYDRTIPARAQGG